MHNLGGHIRDGHTSMTNPSQTRALHQMVSDLAAFQLKGCFPMPGHDVGLIVKSTGDGSWRDRDGNEYGAASAGGVAYLIQNSGAFIIDGNPIPGCPIRLGIRFLEPLSQHSHILQVNVKELFQARPLDLHYHCLPLVCSQMYL